MFQLIKQIETLIADFEYGIYMVFDRQRWRDNHPQQLTVWDLFDVQQLWQQKLMMLVRIGSVESYFFSFWDIQFKSVLFGPLSNVSKHIGEGYSSLVVVSSAYLTRIVSFPAALRLEEYTVYSTEPVPDTLCNFLFVRDFTIQNYRLGAISNESNNPIINMVWEMEFIYSLLAKMGWFIELKAFEKSTIRQRTCGFKTFPVTLSKLLRSFQSTVVILCAQLTRDLLAIAKFVVIWSKTGVLF